MRVAAEAEREIEQAVRYHEHERPGTGAALYRRIERIIDRIGEFPLMYELVGKHHHRAVIQRYAYAVFYRVYEDHVEITAVLPTIRHPLYVSARTS